MARIENRKKQKQDQFFSRRRAAGSSGPRKVVGLTRRRIASICYFRRLSPKHTTNTFKGWFRLVTRPESVNVAGYGVPVDARSHIRTRRRMFVGTRQIYGRLGTVHVPGTLPTVLIRFRRSFKRRFTIPVTVATISTLSPPCRSARFSDLDGLSPSSE